MDSVTIANAEGTTTDTTEIVITGTETEMVTEIVTEVETATDEMTDADLPVTMADAEGILTITDALMMKIDAVTIDATMTMATAEAAVKTAHLTAAVEGREKMVSALLKEDHRRLKVLFRYPSVNARHPVGTSMPLDMNNILPCRRSKQVGVIEVTNKSNVLTQYTARSFQFARC